MELWELTAMTLNKLEEVTSMARTSEPKVESFHFKMSRADRERLDEIARKHNMDRAEVLRSLLKDRYVEEFCNVEG